MERLSDSVGWQNVDQAADPASYVRSLAARGADQSETEGDRRRLIQALLNVREGDHVLEVGCGLGEDIRALAQIVGKTGRAAAVDRSETMLAEARKRSEGLDLPVEFHLGNAHHLEFPDDSFDGCQAVRTFSVLENPRQALGELIRVARPGGRIVVCDWEWEAYVLDAPDPEVSRKILDLVGRTAMRDPWMGRKLFGLFHQAGLTDIAVVPQIIVRTAPPTSGLTPGRAREAALRAQEAGLVSAVQAAHWVESLEEAALAGRYFAAVTAFIVGGSKP